MVIMTQHPALRARFAIRNNGKPVVRRIAGWRLGRRDWLAYAWLLSWGKLAPVLGSYPPHKLGFHIGWAPERACNTFEVGFWWFGFILIPEVTRYYVSLSWRGWRSKAWYR